MNNTADIYVVERFIRPEATVELSPEYTPEVNTRVYVDKNNLKYLNNDPNVNVDDVNTKLRCTPSKPIWQRGIWSYVK